MKATLNKFSRGSVVAALFIITLLASGCSYTHPSVSEPDLVEKITSGHIVCYYKTGPGRGYARCCDDCPMHDTTSQTITRSNP